MVVGILENTELHRNFLLKVELCYDLVNWVFAWYGDEKLSILFSSRFNFRDKLEISYLIGWDGEDLLKQIISLLYCDMMASYIVWTEIVCHSMIELKCERNLNRLDLSFGIVLKPFRNEFDKSLINKSFK